MKKKLLSLSLCAAMAMSLMACGSSSTSTTSTNDASSDTVSTSSDNTTSDNTASDGSYTIKDGVLMVGMEIGYPPMEYFDADGTTPIGFDVEVSKAVADYLGLEIEYVDTAWDGIFAGVNTDKYDVIFSSVSILESRQKEYNMSKPYVSNHTVLIVPNDSDIDSLEALAGHSTAVQSETSADDYMREHADELGVELFEYDKVMNCFNELKTKTRVDSVFTDSVVASYYLGDEASDYKTVWENDELEPVGFCAKKGNDALTEKLEEALDALYADGTLGDLCVKYFGTDLSAGLR
jgi:polar amino acid transport system substrate-binding protein